MMTSVDPCISFYTHSPGFQIPHYNEQTHMISSSTQQITHKEFELLIKRFGYDYISCHGQIHTFFETWIFSTCPCVEPQSVFNYEAGKGEARLYILHFIMTKKDSARETVFACLNDKSFK